MRYQNPNSPGANHQDDLNIMIEEIAGAVVAHKNWKEWLLYAHQRLSQSVAEQRSEANKWLLFEKHLRRNSPPNISDN